MTKDPAHTGDGNGHGGSLCVLADHAAAGWNGRGALTADVCDSSPVLSFSSLVVREFGLERMEGKPRSSRRRPEPHAAVGSILRRRFCGISQRISTSRHVPPTLRISEECQRLGKLEASKCHLDVSHQRDQISD
jgi:hypothetical protein